MQDNLLSSRDTRQSSVQQPSEQAQIVYTSGVQHEMTRIYEASQAPEWPDEALFLCRTRKRAEQHPHTYKRKIVKRNRADVEQVVSY